MARGSTSVGGGAVAFSTLMPGPHQHGRLVVLGGFALFAAAAAGSTLRDLDTPGPYYDEVIQAVPAAGFLAGAPPSAVPGMVSVRVLGRWLPVMTQSYMGGLKSQALIPVFAAAGPSLAGLRTTTVAWGLCGLLLAMLWARRWFGPRCALVLGSLVALDPSFLFVARHDWGSFALGFVCRSAGLLLVAGGWAERVTWRVALGGACFGLGLYNKVDFAVFLAAAGAAWLAADPRAALGELRARRGALVALAGGAAAGAALLLHRIAALGLRGAALFAGSIADPSERLEKWNTLRTTLDGSYFQRLMLAGGRFDRMFEADGAAAGPFLLVFGAASVALAAMLLRDARGGRPARAERFALFVALFTLVAIWLTPRAVRIHHALNALPFPQLVVAVVACRLWSARVLRAPARAAAAAMVLAVLAGSLHVGRETRSTLRDTGGKGRWSDAVVGLAHELERESGAVVVCLDWGFDGPLRLLAPELQPVEPIWTLRREGRWQATGGPSHVYLAHDESYAVFDVSPAFLRAVRQLPSDRAELRRHLDREGDLAFVSVRISQHHFIRYDGDFHIELF
jgi:hypothetical protein